MWISFNPTIIVYILIGWVRFGGKYQVYNIHTWLFRKYRKEDPAITVADMQITYSDEFFFRYTCEIDYRNWLQWLQETIELKSINNLQFFFQPQMAIERPKYWNSHTLANKCFKRVFSQWFHRRKNFEVHYGIKWTHSNNSIIPTIVSENTTNSFPLKKCTM